MSSSAKEFYDLEQESAYNERLDRIKKLKPEEILKALESIDTNIQLLDIDKMRLKHTEWWRLDQIRRATHKLLTGKDLQ
jgi:hypothetical protein